MVDQSQQSEASAPGPAERRKLRITLNYAEGGIELHWLETSGNSAAQLTITCTG